MYDVWYIPNLSNVYHSIDINGALYICLEISRTKEEQSLIDAKSADIPYSRHASALSRASKPGGSPAKNSSYKIRRVSNSTTSSQ